jgi:hypothetical protein
MDWVTDTCFGFLADPARLVNKRLHPGVTQAILSVGNLPLQALAELA